MVNRATVHTNYEDIVAAFGPSEGPTDDGKVLAEWFLETPHGKAEIYDFKSEEKRPEDVTEWHVQGSTPEAANWVVEAVDGRT